MLGIEAHTPTKWRNALVATAVLTVIFSTSGAYWALAGEASTETEVRLVPRAELLVARAELREAQLLLARVDRDVSDALNAVSLAIEAVAVATDPFERQSVPGGAGGV